jgi:D-alanine-D-alanine ligase
LEPKVAVLTEKYGSTLVEEYVDGREFSVLVCGNPDPAGRPLALLPVEFSFREGESFKTYDLKMHQHRPECNVPCDDPLLAERLKDAACNVFSACSAVGYARMDFRLSKDNDLFFLEWNFDCSVFYPEGFEGTADYILKFDGLGQAGFLRKIIEEGLARHARRTKSYAVRQSKIGYGVFATRRIAAGEIVMRGEESPHRIATGAHVERHWSRADKEVFYRYAYPLGKEVYAFWDRDPTAWSPQNHSCDPNTGFSGLNVMALRDINIGEELTIDYSTFCDGHMPSFECQCGSPKCRGRIAGSRGLFGA